MNTLLKQKRTYSIADFYVFMEEPNNILLCTHPYVFTNLSYYNFIISGELHIENKNFSFEVDAMDIVDGLNEGSNSIVIEGYRFSLL